MTKQFISSDGATYLKTEKKDTKKYFLTTRLVDVLTHLDNPLYLKERALLNKVLMGIMDINKNCRFNLFRQENGIIEADNTNKSSRYDDSYECHVYSLDHVDKVSIANISELNVEAYHARNKSYYEAINNKDGVLSAIEKVSSLIKEDEHYLVNSLGDKLPGSIFLKEVSEFKDILQSVDFESINFGDYSLKKYIKEDKSIENKKLYYIISKEEFITLSRTKHSRVMFGWSSTKDINKAFVFSGSHLDYCLPFSVEQKLTKVYLDVCPTSVENESKSALAQELAIQIEKRDMSQALPEKADAVKQRKKSNKL